MGFFAHPLKKVQSRSSKILNAPRAWAPLIDDRVIQEYASDAFEFHFVKRPQMDERIRLPQDQTVGDLTPAELLQKYWQASHVPEADVKALQELAAVILQDEGEETEETEVEEENTELVVQAVLAK
jgi:pyridoxal/pyridoxine/pyridoxamine kinase